MAENSPLPDFHRCLPVELHEQADAFIRYLRELPDKSTVECPHYGHQQFRTEALTNPRLPACRCGACGKGFNYPSQNLFPGCGHTQLWSDFGQCLLAGWSTPVAANALGISYGTTWRWIKPCRAVMAEKFPALHQWWSARQDRTDLTPPPHIAVQARTFLSVLEHLMTTQQAVCSQCGSLHMQHVEAPRPGFYCYGCSKTLSPSDATELSRSGPPEQWLCFAQGVINGESLADLQRRTAFRETACKRWHVRFIQMMDQQGHAELIQWIAWLRSRRTKELLVNGRARIAAAYPS
ncbi:hypothetical protein ACYZT9_00405 [Pseudomonas sp. ZT5P21]